MARISNLDLSSAHGQLGRDTDKADRTFLHDRGSRAESVARPETSRGRDYGPAFHPSGGQKKKETAREQPNDCGAAKHSSAGAFRRVFARHLLPRPRAIAVESTHSCRAPSKAAKRAHRTRSLPQISERSGGREATVCPLRGVPSVTLHPRLHERSGWDPASPLSSAFFVVLARGTASKLVPAFRVPSSSATSVRLSRGQSDVFPTGGWQLGCDMPDCFSGPLIFVIRAADLAGERRWIAEVGSLLRRVSVCSIDRARPCTRAHAG